VGSERCIRDSGDPSLKIYTASISPKGIALSAEIADGLIPVWMNPQRFDLYKSHLDQGFAKAGGGKNYDTFDFAPFVTCIVGEDIESCRKPVKSMLALYIGGMGARGKNFYNDYAKRMGYEKAAKEIQDLYLDGKKNEAMALVPDKLVDETALVGPREHIIERLGAWKGSPIKSIFVNARQPEALRLLAEQCL